MYTDFYLALFTAINGAILQICKQIQHFKKQTHNKTNEQ